MWKRARRWMSRWTGSYPLTLNGIRYDCDGAHADFWYRLDRGRWEPETFRVLDTLLTPESCYWDVGAWIGPTALYAARRCQTVVAFEPDPVAFATLKRNIDTNRLSNVLPQPAAVGAASGTLKLAPPQGSDFGTSVTSVLFAGTDRSDAISAEVHSPKTWIDKKGLPAPHAMKIDIEGAEFQLLPSLIDFFHQHRPSVFLSLHAPWAQNPQKSLQSLVPALSLFPYCYDSELHPQIATELLSARSTETEFTGMVLSFRPLQSSGAASRSRNRRAA